MDIISKGIGIRKNGNGVVDYNAWCVIREPLLWWTTKNKYYVSGSCINGKAWLVIEGLANSWYESEDIALKNLNAAIEYETNQLLDNTIISYKEKII